MAYWDKTEPDQGQYDWTDLDYMIDGATKSHAQVVLAIGRKLPRWPECHDPYWLESLSFDSRVKEVLAYERAVVMRYGHNPTITGWQVENETMFPFGNCEQPFGLKILQQEVQQVKDLDSKPVMVTDSGEWSPFWPLLARYGDVLGVSTYRTSWNNLFGFVPFPVSPGFYILRQNLVFASTKIISSELQAEPWGPKSIPEMPLSQQVQLMSVQQMKDNIIFAREAGFDETYLWGVEWWYWMKDKGHSEYWETAKNLWQKTTTQTRF